MQSILPDLVVTANDPSKTLGLNYPGFIAPMVKAMQELKADNDNLRLELKAENDNYMQLRQEVEILKRAVGKQ